MADSTDLQAMLEEMRNSSPQFRPSGFWDWLIAQNLGQLGREGLERFKSTVNQNYYNWIPLNFGDNQVRNLTRYWCEHPSLVPLRAVLEGTADVEHLAEAAPLADAGRRELYALFVGLLWHYASQHDPHRVLERLSEPDVGSPVGVRLGERLISQDLANSAREFTAVMECLPQASELQGLRIAELGAGYGRLAYVFASCLPCRYWIFDLPPALHIAQWYLSSVLPQKKIFKFRHFENFAAVQAEVDAADVCFFTPNQLPLIADRSVDAFVSICSLQEMRPESIRAYLRLMRQKARELVYLKQWIRGVNPVDGITIHKHFYTLGADWRVVLDRKDAVQDLFFETAFRRGLTVAGILSSWRRQIGSRLAAASASIKMGLQVLR